MNYFFALELSSEARQAVATLVDDWKRLIKPFQHAKWYGQDDYHITLKFLGNLPDTVQPQLMAAASPIAERAISFPINLARTGMFPDVHHPKVLWVGVTRTPPLTNLASALDQALSGIGYALEEHPFKPHVTIARSRFALEGETWVGPDEQAFPIFTANAFVLLQTLQPNERQNDSKSRYNIVHTFPFGTTPALTQ